MELTIAQLAKMLSAELVGDGEGVVNRVGPVESAGKNEVTFADNIRHTSKLASSKAGAVIVGSKVKGIDIPQLIVKDVNHALIQSLNIFAPALKKQPAGVDPTAKVADDVQLSEGISIGPNVSIESGVRIGQNTVIAAGCRIGQNTIIGSNCRLDPNVVVYHNCRLGNNVIIQANTTIGSTGFGYCFIDGSHQLIPHNGGVIIEDFVEIGANCCIDRAKFGNTTIGAGTKIDNLVQIAHNCIIGKCCLIAGLSGIAGSTILGDGVVLAGGVGILDHLKVGKGAMVGGRSCVFKDIKDGQKVLGTPAIESTVALKLISLTRRLPKFAEQLNQLSERVKKLEAAEDNKK